MKIETLPFRLLKFQTHKVQRFACFGGMAQE